ncbi:DUF1616 domain-containing protein [Halorarius litoreus]|uniref:DUF1616 domain-containing protein n=1 Tax=Halorarius litoreus TaxID=2962676 RepID=UPI0020CB7D93|nr:DUF1616 domain-containing protein [Halorarius litoreus]
MSRPFRSTGDLLLVVAWTSFTVAAMLAGLGTGSLRTVLALPLVVLFPGYTLLAVLFPERADAGSDEEGASISDLERGALSVVMSLALVPLLAFVVNYTSYGLRLLPLAVTIGGVTLGLALLGYLARVRLPVEHRFSAPGPGRVTARVARFLSKERRDLRAARPLQPTTGTHRFFNVLLAVSVLTLVATAGYTAVTPPANDDPFTEFYLTTQDGDGEYVTEGLPHEFSSGESQSLFVTIGNREGQRVPYTVVITLDGTELDRFSTAVGAGNTKYVEQSVSPSQTGDRLRLSFLLYRGDVPETPTPENAYRETHLWISVSG